MTDAEEIDRRIGTTLRGKWTIERKLGEGGMASVYVGVHKIGRRDAIKILHASVARSADLRSRFEREARAVNHFQHPGAVEIRDMDLTEDGLPFLVMELLEGESLAQRAQRLQGLPLNETLRYVDALLDVLIKAHEAGIVHRDIKLDNLFLTTDGRLKVLDFGVANMVDGAAKTRAGATLGTLSYMPPEQVRGDAIDGRADLFAVGALMFRVLARRKIHEAPSEPELLIKMATTPAPSLTAAAPEVPASVALVVDRALAFDKDARYPLASVMQEDVQALLRGAPPPFATLKARLDLEVAGAPTMGAPAVLANAGPATVAAPQAMANAGPATVAAPQAMAGAGPATVAAPQAMAGAAPATGTQPMAGAAPATATQPMANAGSRSFSDAPTSALGARGSSPALGHDWPTRASAPSRAALAVTPAASVAAPIAAVAAPMAAVPVTPKGTMIVQEPTMTSLPPAIAVSAASPSVMAPASERGLERFLIPIAIIAGLVALIGVLIGILWSRPASSDVAAVAGSAAPRVAGSGALGAAPGGTEAGATPTAAAAGPAEKPAGEKPAAERPAAATPVAEKPTAATPEPTVVAPAKPTPPGKMKPKKKHKR